MVKAYRLLLALMLVFTFQVCGEIRTFDIVATNPSLPLPALKNLGSAMEMKLHVDADQGRYNILAYADDSLSQIVADKRNIDFAGGEDDFFLKVPLEEGENGFFFKMYQTSGGAAEKTTNTGFMDIRRDLCFDVTSIRLDYLEAHAGSVNSSRMLQLYTTNAFVDLHYTVNGNSDGYKIDVYRNFALLQSETITEEGSNYITNVELEENVMNIFQLKVTSTDANAAQYSHEAESNVLRIFHDTVAPEINSIEMSFQDSTPTPGLWGPTDLSVIGISVSVSNVDMQGARVRIFDQRRGNEYTRMVKQDGRTTIAGIELSRDPTLGEAGVTPTTYTVEVWDAAGNFNAETVTVERMTLNPCFNLLMMTPGDEGFVKTGEAVSIQGAVCDEYKPYRVTFFLSSPFSGSSYYKEEELSNIFGGEVFDKDISLPINGTSPNENVAYSVQARVYTSSPFDPAQEVSSSFHELGTVILDRKPPVAPTLITESVMFATNSPAFIVDGQVEQFGTVLLSSQGSLQFSPGRIIPAVGDEFRVLVNLAAVSDGEYKVDLSAYDRAGNTGVDGTTNIILKVDKTAPGVEAIRINDKVIESSRPLFFKPGEAVNIKVLMDEALANAPRLWITEQGNTVTEAGLLEIGQERHQFEYQYVVRESDMGEHDGYVELLVTGGSDSAGNSVDPPYREPHAFVVDTLPPVLKRTDVVPSDGSVINSTPLPLRLVMTENPETKDVGSGPDTSACRVVCKGPIETNPDRVVSGRFEIFDPRTLDFYPDPDEMNLDGTYLFEVLLADKVGNTFTESIVLQLDKETLSTNLIVSTSPVADVFFNAETLPSLNGRHIFSVALDTELLHEVDLNGTQAQLLNYLRTPQSFPLSGPVTLSTTSVQFQLNDELETDGSDDGVLTAIIKIKDTAGNISDEYVYSYYYDTVDPAVMDGESYPLPVGYQNQDLRFPTNGAVVNGPLKSVSAVLYDQKSPTGFLGSGLKTVVDSTGQTLTSTLVLSLVDSFGSAPEGVTVTGRVKFKSDLTGSAPIYGGPQVIRMLYEMNVSPVSLEPLGLATGGDFDGIYSMTVIPVDMSDNAGIPVTSYFYYDTLAPAVSVDVDNEVWITSGVIRLSGTVKDQGTIPVQSNSFGSLKGMGVQTVEIKVDAVNSMGSATVPSLVEWTEIPLGRNISLYPADQEFTFDYEQRFHDFQGPVRITVRAWDKAGNAGVYVRDLGMDSDTLDSPVLISPEKDAYLKGGVAVFRWNPVEKASGYLFVLTDKDGNDKEYPLDRGVIDLSLNLDFMQAGESIWRVYAIDGVGNRSARDNGRTFRLDRGGPYVQQVRYEQPSGSSDSTGRVLEKVLRFEVEFSEDLDELNEPDVRFWPASKSYLNSLGQEVIETYPSIKLSQLNFKANQYAGSFSFKPVEKDWDYNGIGQVTVKDYTDLAGNDGMPFTTSFEVDLGPYFEFRIFSNPVNEKELIFVVKGLHQKGGLAEELNSIPAMEVRQLKNPDGTSSDDRVRLVSLTRLASSYFHGSFLMDLGLSGSLQIQITGEDIQGNMITRVLPFEISELPDSRQGSTSQSRYYIFPWYTKDEKADGLIPVYNVFPDVSSSVSIPVSVALSQYSLAEHGKYAVLERNASDELKWISQRSTGDTIHASSSHLSRLVLMEDSVSPSLEWEQGEQELQSLDQDFLFRAEDAGVGIDGSRLQVYVNGEPRDYVSLESGLYAVPYSVFQNGGEYNVVVKARDYLGNNVEKAVSVVAAGPVRIHQAVVTPNPVKKDASLELRMSRAVDSCNLSLYDVSSARIAYLELGQLNSSARVSLFSMIHSLANGVYFLKVQVIDTQGNMEKKTLKFAVLR